jgi:hypothetical protein
MEKNSRKNKIAGTTAPNQVFTETRPVDVAQARKQITDSVRDAATELATVLIEKGKGGELACVKYLFEIAGLYPAAAASGSANPEEGNLLQALIGRLGLPEEFASSPEKPDGESESHDGDEIRMTGSAPVE